MDFGHKGFPVPDWIFHNPGQERPFQYRQHDTCPMLLLFIRVTSSLLKLLTVGLILQYN